MTCFDEEVDTAYVIFDIKLEIFNELPAGYSAALILYN